MFAQGHIRLRALSKRRQISTQIFQYLPQHQFSVLPKIPEKSVEMFSRNWRFSDVMFKRSASGNHGFVIFLSLVHNIQNFDISKIISYEIQNYQVILKRNTFYPDTYKQHACKLSKQHLFWLCNGKKKGKGDDVTFLRRKF